MGFKGAGKHFESTWTRFKVVWFYNNISLSLVKNYKSCQLFLLKNIWDIITVWPDTVTLILIISITGMVHWYWSRSSASKCYIFIVMFWRIVQHQARSQKILLGGSFEDNVDLFLLQPFSQPQSRSSWWAYILWCVHSPHSQGLVNPLIDHVYSWNIHKKPTITVNWSFQTIIN